MPNDYDPMLSQSAIADACAPCGLHRPMRNAYFDGKMLTARDLTAEQTYLNGMRHLGNMVLEGQGTVCGLKVLSHPQEGCKSTHVVLKAGMALTCCGQEIVVPKDVTIPFRKMLDDDTELQDQLKGENDLVIRLCRQDNPAEMAPVLISDCCSGLDGQLPSRIAEDYGFELAAVAPGSTAIERVVRRPELDWVHSITSEDETPTAVSVDEEEGLVFVGSGLDGAAFVRGYRVETDSLEATLTGWAEITDIATPRVGPWMFVAGRRGTNYVVAAYPRNPDHLSEPVQQVTVGGRSQLAVSPVTGTLFVLTRMANNNRPRLRGWNAEQIAAGFGTPVFNLTSTVELGNPPMDAGCRVIEVSPEGRTLAFLLPGLANKSVRLANVSELLSGGVANLAATEVAIMSENGTDLTPDFVESTSLRFSYDGAVLHVAGRVVGQTDQATYRRVALTETGPVQSGGGLTFGFPDDAATWPALYVAPDERWVYVSTAVERGTDGSGDGRLVVLSTDPAKTPGEGPVAVEPIQNIPLNAQLSGGTMRLRGQRLYVPGFETIGAAAGDTPAPVMGRVMVIDIAEADIAGIFEDAIEGCRACADACSCVTLAHIPGYVFAADPPPRVMDQGQAVGETDVNIDNLSYRPLVPSNVTLMEAILEIAARGVESGPPGPRGEDGVQGNAGPDGTPGTDGRSIVEVVYGNVATPELREVQNGSGDWVLILPQPVNGTNGTNGANGRSITRVVYGNVAQPTLSDDNTAGGDLLLTLPQPVSGGTGDVDPDAFQFVRDKNWQDGQVFTLADLQNGGFDEALVSLVREVTNPDILFTPCSTPVAHFYFSGVFEIRVHFHRDGVNRDPFVWVPAFEFSRTFQYGPRFAKTEEVFDGKTFTVSMAPLWPALGVAEIPRARVEFVLHGSFLTNADKVPFDGRVDPGAAPELSGQVGGTWRSWIEVQSK